MTSGLATKKLQECAEQVRSTRTVVRGKGCWIESEGKGSVREEAKVVCGGEKSKRSVKLQPVIFRFS